MSTVQGPGGQPDRTVLVTGAAGGLGRAFALGFARRGYRVAVADVDLAGAEETARLVNDTGATRPASTSTSPASRPPRPSRKAARTSATEGSTSC